MARLQPVQPLGQQPARLDEGAEARRERLEKVWLTAASASTYLDFPSYRAFWDWQKRLNARCEAQGLPPALVPVRIGRRLRYRRVDLDRAFALANQLYRPAFVR